VQVSWARSGLHNETEVRWQGIYFLNNAVSTLVTVAALFIIIYIFIFFEPFRVLFCRVKTLK
jgi:hypothetical protein